MLKNILFSISKYYFIYFNNTFYNTLNIKGFIIFTNSIKYIIIFLFFKLFLFSFSSHFFHTQILLKNNYKIQTILLVRQGLKQISFLTNRVQRTRFCYEKIECETLDFQVQIHWAKSSAENSNC